MLQKVHLKNYFKGDSVQRPGRSKSQGRNAYGNPRSKKGKESSKGAINELCATPLIP